MERLPASFIQPSPFYKKVFFHGDVLQARNLPAMDEDALVNPWWTIEVEGEVGPSEGAWQLAFTVALLLRMLLLCSSAVHNWMCTILTHMGFS